MWLFLSESPQLEMPDALLVLFGELRGHVLPFQGENIKATVFVLQKRSSNDVVATLFT
jgi:hypothetical protein